MYNRVEEKDSAITASKTTYIHIPFTLVYNRIEEEENNDSVITAIQVSSKTTFISFTLGVQ